MQTVFLLQGQQQDIDNDLMNTKFKNNDDNNTSTLLLSCYPLLCGPMKQHYNRADYYQSVPNK